MSGPSVCARAGGRPGQRPAHRRASSRHTHHAAQLPRHGCRHPPPSRARTSEAAKGRRPARRAGAGRKLARLPLLLPGEAAAAVTRVVEHATRGGRVSGAPCLCGACVCVWRRRDGAREQKKGDRQHSTGGATRGAVTCEEREHEREGRGCRSCPGRPGPAPSTRLRAWAPEALRGARGHGARPVPKNAGGGAACGTLTPLRSPTRTPARTLFAGLSGGGEAPAEWGVLARRFGGRAAQERQSPRARTREKKKKKSGREGGRGSPHTSVDASAKKKEEEVCSAVAPRPSPAQSANALVGSGSPLRIARRKARPAMRGRPWKRAR